VCVPYWKCDRGTDGSGIFGIRNNLNVEVNCETLQDCCEESFINHTIPKFATAAKCGKRNIDGLGYYLRGRNNEAQFGEVAKSSSKLAINF
jgi:hypothetical protein